MVKVIHIFTTLSFEKDILYGSSAKIHVFPNTKIKQKRRHAFGHREQGTECCGTPWFKDYQLQEVAPWPVIG